MRFAILTANPREQNVVRHFLKLGAGAVWDGAQKCTWDNDALLGEVVRVEFVHKTSDYEVFKLVDKKNASNVVAGVHMKLPQVNATIVGGVTGSTFQLLKEADKQNWSLEVIFAVGCCQVNMEKPDYGKRLRGAVLLSSNLEDYLGQGKARDTGLDPQMYQLSPAWTSYLSEIKITQPLSCTGLFRNIPVKELHKIQTGTLAIKDTGFGKKICASIPVVGLGTALTKSKKRVSIPDLAVVNGVSESGKEDKNWGKDTSFFGRVHWLRDDNREEVATFHAIALVIRGVAVKLLDL